jgi:hypothetical protein
MLIQLYLNITHKPNIELQQQRQEHSEDAHKIRSKAAAGAELKKIPGGD